MNVRKFLSRARLGRALVAVVAVGLVPVAAMATPSNFTVPTGFDASTLFSEVVEVNKSLILGGAAGVTFMWLVARVVKGFRGGSMKVVK